jgi:tripartite-type tricarboxylate transporter receptor subunit TctC
MICLARVLLLALLAFPAAAQPNSDYPTRPIRIVVPYSAGGGADLLARLMGEELATRLGQAVLIENRSGASGTIGLQSVATAERDGYTLGLVTPIFVMTPAVMKNHPYDPLRDFAPVGAIGFTPLVLVVHPGVAAKTIPEFVALARAHPGTLNYASLGPASTQGLAATLFKTMTGIEATEIPYKGSAPGLADLLAGNVQFMFNALPSLVGHVTTGRLRGLGVSSAKASPVMPEIPPIRDAIPGYEVTTWYALVAPAGTPAVAIERLNLELASILRTRKVRARLFDQGVEPGPMSPDELAAHLRTESAKWTRLIRDAGLPAE